MMQKNETELIDKWIEFHGKLFGFENLYIFDNGSTDTLCIESLKKFERLGVNITWDHNTPQHFEQKGEIVGEKIKELESLELYHYFLPLDCDEFLGVISENGNISFDINDINKELYHLSGRDEILLIKGHYYNSPISDVHFSFRSNRKCFFYKGNFESIDIGYHWGKNKHSNIEIRTNLIHVHFHNKPFIEAKKYAAQKLKSRVDIYNLKELKEFDGRGAHLKNYFFINEFNYISDIIKNKHINTFSIKQAFDHKNVDWPYIDHIENNEITFKNGTNLEKIVINPEHEDTMGNIDNVKINNNKIILSGWAVKEKKPLKYFNLIINDDIIFNIENLTLIKREDIISLFKLDEMKYGFSLQIDIGNIFNKNIYISNIDLYSENLGEKINIKNRKKIDMLMKLNDFSYRSKYLIQKA